MAGVDGDAAAAVELVPESLLVAVDDESDDDDVESDEEVDESVDAAVDEDFDLPPRLSVL